MAGMGRTRAFALLVLCLALVILEVHGKGLVGGPPGGNQSPNNEKIFNVLQFGAKQGGKADSTQGFVDAWVDACRFNGNARVLVPQGIFKVSELIFQGPCQGQAPIIFQVIGTIKADSDLSNYPDNGWITFDTVTGLLITGEGTIDGQGQSVWQYDDCKTNFNCVHLPASLYFNNVNNAKIRGIHLMDAMGFHIHVTSSNNVRISGITVTASGDSPNTDGVHISKSETVKIGKSVIGTGDDCVSIGQGASNVTVNKVTCGPGHGISVGSLGKLPNEMDVRGIIVKNCTLTGTTNGLRIKTWPNSDPSRASGILFSDIVMNNVQNPIIIDQGYGGKSSIQPSRVKISNVIYRNIEGTTTSPVAVSLMCSKLFPCDNLSFHNINLKFIGARPPGGLLTSTCANAKVGYSGVQIPPPCS